MFHFDNRKAMNVAVLSLLILLASGLSACNKFKSSEALVSEAIQHQQSGDNKSAIIQLKNALQKDPDNAEARYLLGTIYNEEGDPLSAEKELRKALSIGLSPDKVMSDLAKALLVQGQFQEVLDETSNVPDNAEILTLRGSAYLALGQNLDAKESFENALKENASYPDALIGMAKYFIVENDFASASRYSENAVEHNPESINAWLFKGDLLRTEGKTDAAIAVYDQVLQLAPDNIMANISKASLAIATGQFDAAKAHIEAAKKSSPNNLIVFYTQALLDFSQKNPAAALESLQQILRVAPKHMPSVLMAGAVQFALGSMPQAEQHLKKYLEVNPSSVYARKLLASTYLRNYHAQYAIDVLTPVLISAQKDPQLFALAGNAYTQAGNYTKAEEYFKKAAALAPESAEIRTALGLNKLALGDNERAVAEMEQAVNLDTGSHKASITLVLTHLRLQDYDKALVAADGLIKEQPEDPLGYSLKGSAYLGKDANNEARASFEKAVEIQPAYFLAVANLVRLDQLENKPDEAQQRLQALLDNDKKNIQVLSALAGLALSQGKTEEATVWLERARNENPDALQPAFTLASHYLRIGEKQKALTLAKKLQASNPESPEALDMLAQAQFANGDKVAALDSYNKLAIIKPDSPLAHFRIASVQIANENQAAASASLKKSLSLQPDYLDAQLALAALEVRQDNFDEALSIARKIQDKHNKSPLGYTLEGDILKAQKKSTLAVKAYEKAFAVGKSGPLMIKLHAALSQIGKTREAASRMKLWVKEHPEDVLARMYLGNVLIQQNNIKAAIQQFEAIVQQDPKNAAALNDLAWAYQRENDPRALEYAEKAIQLVPENASVLDTLGWILIEQGNTDKGLPLLQKAHSLSPEIPEIHFHLVFGLAKSGDNTQARQELEKLLASGKDFPQIDKARALLKKL